MTTTYKYDPLLKPEYPTHLDLVKYGLATLRGMGFKDSQIYIDSIFGLNEFATTNNVSFTYKMGKTWSTLIPDLVGYEENGKKVAIEAGKCGYEKLFALKYFYDDVIWIPHFFQYIETDQKTLMDMQHKQFNELTQEYERKMKQLDDKHHTWKINTIADIMRVFDPHEIRDGATIAHSNFKFDGRDSEKYLMENMYKIEELQKTVEELKRKNALLEAQNEFYRIKNS